MALRSTVLSLVLDLHLLVVTQKYPINVTKRRNAPLVPISPLNHVHVVRILLSRMYDVPRTAFPVVNLAAKFSLVVSTNARSCVIDLESAIPVVKFAANPSQFVSILVQQRAMPRQSVRRVIHVKLLLPRLVHVATFKAVLHVAHPMPTRGAENLISSSATRNVRCVNVMRDWPMLWV